MKSDGVLDCVNLLLWHFLNNHSNQFKYFFCILINLSKFSLVWKNGKTSKASLKSFLSAVNLFSEHYSFLVGYHSNPSAEMIQASLGTHFCVCFHSWQFFMLFTVLSVWEVFWLHREYTFLPPYTEMMASMIILIHSTEKPKLLSCKMTYTNNSKAAIWL